MSKGLNNIVSFINELSIKEGFADWSYTEVSQLLDEQEDYMSALEKGYFADMSYLCRNIDKRFNPSLLVEGAKVIILFLAPYNSTNSKGVASYAWGKDYHLVIKEKLFRIFNELNNYHNSIEGEESFSGRVFTDSAPVLERAWAAKAGLGFIGKNGLLISRKAGIKTLIGSIICNLTLPHKLSGTNRSKSYCGNCTKCLDACPTGALCAPYTLDARKCISYNSIESKMPNLELNYNGWYFGCDECVNACPWNRKNLTGWEEFSCNSELLDGATSRWWSELTKGEFKRLFKDSPLFRGGLRNIVTLANKQSVIAPGNSLETDDTPNY